MTHLQTELQRAAHDLGLKIVVPYTLDIRSGLQIRALALLPQIGAENGMLIVDSFAELKGIANELVDAGYGYSVLDDPLPSTEYDLHSYIEMFSEWGWGATNETKPDWMM